MLSKAEYSRIFQLHSTVYGCLSLAAAKKILICWLLSVLRVYWDFLRALSDSNHVRMCEVDWGGFFLLDAAWGGEQKQKRSTRKESPQTTATSATQQPVPRNATRNEKNLLDEEIIKFFVVSLTVRSPSQHRQWHIHTHTGSHLTTITFHVNLHRSFGNLVCLLR